jgi:Fe-S-cluster containining protein
MLLGMGLPAGDAQLVQIMDAALEDAAKRAGTGLAGSGLACRPGCTQCCHGAFAINALDVERLRAGMDALRVADPAAAAAVQERARAWVGEFGKEFPGDPVTGVLGELEEERARFENFANDAACPALNPVTGLCDVYEWRPMTCRVFGPPVWTLTGDGEGLSCCELCFVGASEAEIAACAMDVPHELEARLVEETRHATGRSGETVVAFAVLGKKPAEI